MGNLGHLTWVRHSHHKSSATHSYQCVQYFRVQTMYLGFLTCTQMLVNVIAHSGCVDTIRESALETDSGRKMLCRTRDSNPHQRCAGLFSRMLYQLSYWWNSIYWWKSDTCPANMMELIHICLMILAHQLASSLDLFSNYLTSQPEPNCLWAGYIQAFFGRRELNQMQEVGSGIYDPTWFWLHTGHTRW